MALERNFAENKYFVGEDKELEFEILGDDVVLSATELDEDGNPAVVSGTPVDVTGWALTWILRNSQSAADPALLTKATGGSGIQITGSYNATRDLNTQRVLVTVEDTDTWNPPTTEFAAKEYAYSLKRTDAGSETVLVFGALPIGKVTARA